MMHKYEFKLVCRCPNDNSVNIYDVTIKSDEAIQAEDFNKFQDKIYNEKYYQEDIYEILQKTYDNVMLVGTHLGIKIISSK